MLDIFDAGKSRIKSMFRTAVGHDLTMQYTSIRPWQLSDVPLKCRFQWRDAMNCTLVVYIEDLNIDKVIDEIKGCSASELTWSPIIHTDPERGRYIKVKLPPNAEICHHVAHSVETLYTYHQDIPVAVAQVAPVVPVVPVVPVAPVAPVAPLVDCLIALYSPRIWARVGSEKHPDAQGISFQCHAIRIFD